MARYFKQIAIWCWLLAAVLLTACQEGGAAGELFGQWRMTGSETRFISFSGTFVRFMDTSQGEVFGNFRHVGDSLFIKCYSVYGTPSDTALVEQTFGLKPFADMHIKVELPDDEHLVLSNGSQTLSLYKY